MSKTDEKKVFTLRLNQELIDRINQLSGDLGVSKAQIARNFIQLSDFFFLEPNLELKTFTKMPLSIFPIEILKELIQFLPEKNYISIGDKLGTIINNNSQIIGLQTLEEKRGLIQGLNWINFTPVTLIDEEDDTKSKEKQKSKNNQKNKEQIIKQIKIQYWGIPKDIWPLEMIHAMLFRIKYNQRYNSHWESIILKKFLRQTKKKRTDFQKNPKKGSPEFTKAKDFILKIAFEIGSRKENFENEFNYYYFDVFRIEDDKNQE